MPVSTLSSCWGKHVHGHCTWIWRLDWMTVSCSSGAKDGRRTSPFFLMSWVSTGSGFGLTFWITGSFANLVKFTQKTPRSYLKISKCRNPTHVSESMRFWVWGIFVVAPFRWFLSLTSLCQGSPARAAIPGSWKWMGWLLCQLLNHFGQLMWRVKGVLIGEAEISRVLQGEFVNYM